MFCILFGVFCMTDASFYIPGIVLKSRKFVLLFSMGSVFFIASFFIHMVFQESHETFN
jgi:hypothetical protein